MFKKYSALFLALSLTLAFVSDAPAYNLKKRNLNVKTYKSFYPPSQNEKFAMHALRTIHSAQMTYESTFGQGNFGTLIQLQLAGLIDPVLASGDKYGYYFSMSVFMRTASTPSSFDLTAVPKRYRKTGHKSFYIDENCELRGADKSGATANVGDPVLQKCTPSVRAENERETIAALRTLVAAQAVYQATNGNGNYGTIDELFEANLISQNLALGFYRFYRLTVTVTERTATTDAFFKIQATPMQYPRVGIRSFYVDVNGVVRGDNKNGQPADGTEPPVEPFSEEQTNN